MDSIKVAERLFAWWVQLFKERGFDSKIGLNPLKVDSKVALMQENGVVYLKAAPRYYFFGFDLQSGEAVFYTFVPEIDFTIKEDLRDEFCGGLEREINESLSENGKGFTKFFTPPIQVSFMPRYFQEIEYHGVNIATTTNRICFSKARDRMRKKALESWRKKVFIPASKFFEANSSKYLLKKK